MRHVFESMGTVVSVDAPLTELPHDVMASFAELDARFSLYRADSELSRVARGELPLMEASEALREAYSAALEWRALTDGAFTPNRPDGTVDLNGIVKAMAIERAGRALTDAGVAGWSVNAGGDVLVAGAGWRTGVANPRQLAIICSVELRDTRRAIATSGSAERGDHIWGIWDDAKPQFTQVTVMADDIVTADVLATAIVAGGRATLDLVTERWDVDVFAIQPDGALIATQGFRDALAA